MATRKAPAKKSVAKKSPAKKSAPKKSTTPPSRRWSAKVDTDSTHPDHELFLQSAPKIAKALAHKRVSPKGPASGMRMLNFYINRAGKNLSQERIATLERAKKLLSGIIAKSKEDKEEAPAKKAAPKKAAKKSAAKKATKQAAKQKSANSKSPSR
jgi:tRNA(adenine34) deaminase